jgi:caffeoyl-CoA O-methyltransferase
MPRQLVLDERLYSYLVDHSVREHPAQVALRAATAGLKYAGMQIGPDQGQFMGLLTKLSADEAYSVDRLEPSR